MLGELESLNSASSVLGTPCSLPDVRGSSRWLLRTQEVNDEALYKKNLANSFQAYQRLARKIAVVRQEPLWQQDNRRGRREIVHCQTVNPACIA